MSGNGNGRAGAGQEGFVIDRADLRTFTNGVMLLVTFALSMIAFAGILGLAVQAFRHTSGL